MSSNVDVCLSDFNLFVKSSVKLKVFVAGAGKKNKNQIFENKTLLNTDNQKGKPT